MKGVCRKCGCTEAHACPGGCSWIDTQEDLCSRCAAELMTAPLDNLSDALLVVRALRSTVADLVEHVINLGQQVAFLTATLGGGEIDVAAQTPGKIWTPE